MSVGENPPTDILKIAADRLIVAREDYLAARGLSEELSLELHREVFDEIERLRESAMLDSRHGFAAAEAGSDELAAIYFRAAGEKFYEISMLEKL